MSSSSLPTAATSPSPHSSFQLQLSTLIQQIAEVQEEIKEVKQEIKHAAEELKKYKPDDKLWTYWSDEKSKLRDKENKLRDQLNLLLQQQQQASVTAAATSQEWKANMEQMHRHAAEQLDILHAQMKELKSVGATRRSLRRTTEEWANDIIQAPHGLEDQQRLQQHLAQVDERSLKAAWDACAELRKKMQHVTKEDAKGKAADVQSLMFALAEHCTSGGPLHCRDTHASNYPSNHKIDLSFVSSASPCADAVKRVTWAEVASFGELKLDVEAEGDYRAVAIQCSDRVVELIEASTRRKRVMFFVADKARIRFFLYDRASDSYVSTDLETLLTTAHLPSHGFRLFYRFCCTTPAELGLPPPPAAPTIPGYTLSLLREGGPGKAKVYRAEAADGGLWVCKSFEADSRSFRAETTALTQLSAVHAPVPQIQRIDEVDRFAIVGPFGTPLRVHPFSIDVLLQASAVCVKALRAAAALDQPLCHYDPSPDNIIVCDDGSVHLNDWGSSRRPGAMTNTGGTNPVYCCPAMGAAFESGLGSFFYTPLSDLRALFISLLAFSLLPRQRGEEQLPGILPWERVAPSMQATKYLHLYGSVRWDLVQPQASPLLRPLHFQLFRVRHVDVALVCRLFEDLRQAHTIPEADAQEDLSMVLAAMRLDACAAANYQPSAAAEEEKKPRAQVTSREARSK